VNLHPCREDSVYDPLVYIKDLRVLDGKQRNDEDICDRQSEHAQAVERAVAHHILHQDVWCVCVSEMTVGRV